MRNILVATDFSSHAYLAAIFAAELARHAGARLILFHAYHPAVLLEEDSIWADKVILEKEVQEKIDALAHELHLTYGLSVTRLLKPGFAIDEMLTVSRKVKADLVVLGAQGAGKRLLPREGKVAAGILQKADFPVICLPPDTTVAGFLPLLETTQTEWQLGNSAGKTLLNTLPLSNLATPTLDPA